MDTRGHVQPRVLIFSLAYFPYLVGGAEIAVHEITKRIPDYEWHLIAIRSRESSVKEIICNVTVYRVGFRVSPHSFLFTVQKYCYPLLATWKGIWLHRTLQFSFVWSIMAAYAGF